MARRFRVATAGFGLVALSGALLAATTALHAQPADEAPTNCDRLTASAYDENAVAEPVTWLVLNRTAERAIAACRAAAEQQPDEPRFQYQLGRALDAAGQFEEASQWYGKVADRPYAAALADVAVLHANGKGIPANPGLAYSLAKQSAELGNLRGMTIAAALQASGIGTDQDRVAARELMLKAARGGHGEAMEFLGDYHLSGAGGTADETAALDWFVKAAEEGRLNAAMAAARLYYKNEETRTEAMKWAKLAARAGHPPAMVILGSMLLRGDGAPPDPDTGLAWLERAAAGDEVTAIFTLGRLYEAGDRIPRDLDKARKYYEDGVAASSGASAFRLARGYDDGRFGTDPALAVEYLVFSALTGFEPARTELLGGLADQWTAESRMALQSRLASEGLYSGPIDGVIGPGTAGAIARLLSP